MKERHLFFYSFKESQQLSKQHILSTSSIPIARVGSINALRKCVDSMHTYTFIVIIIKYKQQRTHPYPHTGEERRKRVRSTLDAKSVGV